jgi:predicted MFS family arabinose efflux permease
MFTLGIGFAFYHLVLQTRATELVPSMRGTAVSLFAFSLFLGRGIGTAVLGLVVTAASYEALILVCGVGMVGLTIATARSRQ